MYVDKAHISLVFYLKIPEMKTAYGTQVGYPLELDETSVIVERCELFPGLRPGKLYHCYITLLTALSCKLISGLLVLWRWGVHLCVTDHFISDDDHCDSLY
jgi:hypothetical protein